MRSTLKAARREYVRRMSSTDLDEALRKEIFKGATFEPHQHQYVLPVFPETLVNEIIDALPETEDLKHVLLVHLLPEDVRFSFFDASQDDDSGPALLPESRSSSGEEPIDVEDELTIGAVMGYLDDRRAMGVEPEEQIDLDVLMKRAEELNAETLRRNRAKRDAD